MGQARRPSIRLLVALFVLGWAAMLPASGQTPEPGPPAPEPGPWVVQIDVDDPATISLLSDELDVWDVVPGKGLGSEMGGEVDAVLAQVDIDDLAWLQASGFRVSVNERLTASLHVPRIEGASGTIPGFPCYRTVERTVSDAEALVAEHPTLASLVDIGDSWVRLNGPGPGYDLWLLRLTNSATPGDKPKFYVQGSIHPREYTTAETVMRFGERLLGAYGVDADATWLLDEHETHLLLFANPDGRKQAETGLSWRKNANNNHCSNTNDRGIDLNRNFSFQWGCCGGSSGSECSQTYRGPSAASEPETQAMQAYVASIYPDQRDPDLDAPAPDDATGLFLDVHSFGQVVLSSWGFQGADPPNGGQLLTLARKYGFYSGYAAQLGSLGTVDGATKDWAYGELGVPGYTIELGTAFFEGCGFFESNILPGNLEALEELAKIVRTPYITPAGPDAVDVAADNGVAIPGEVIAVTALLDDTRYDGAEPSQAIQAAEIYVDVPPWGAGAMPQAMTADDGTFDETVEAATAMLDTTGLSDGRHTVFVRGQDADGVWGTVSAEFLYVLDPATAPRLQGTVRDAVDADVLEATIVAGGFETTSDPGTGFYELLLPEGTYDVVVSAEGYGTTILENIVAMNLDVIVENVYLAPLTTVFFDDVESGAGGWAADSPWAITQAQSQSPVHSWTDSPGGDHGNNLDVSLTSQVFDFSSLAGLKLSFFQRYELESGFDFGYVEVSTDGSTWETVGTVNGAETTWHEVSFDLPQLDAAATARVRFRLSSDVSVTEDGWYVDDVRISGYDPSLLSGLIFSDGFESEDTAAWSTTVP